ncbi:Neuroendocrine convertase 2 [Mizuhopecten yessoensis]|uniref:Neuroendocrine convertase 2 n=1 Tax=Mizuhopecten yessoensis TaxID=6573 RepID=A0A210QK86_MIZYE|nr:Neuroendocrine convertase 2 [Mizuhopecten yessoensis]
MTNDWILQSSADKEAVEELLNDTKFRVIDEIVSGYFWVKQLRNSVDRSSSVSTAVIKRCDHIISFERQKKRKINLRSTGITMNDPLWNKQWYLNDVRAIPSMNIQKAWAKGFTGKGVVIGIVDGGVDVTHPDLSNKVKRSLSYDFIENDNDPSPAYRESHGTKCAGIVVAARNNRNCIVGASFGSTFANLRISDNFGSTPVTESRALVHKYDEIHIYSNSWGVIEGLGFEQQPPVVENAISAAVQKGRNGLGSIFLWASGNGGTNDNCNCDGYAKSINVISIASVSENQYAGYYSEYCSAILASCYSGDDVQYDILTTDIGGSCTNFSGTSASTPLSAAVIALVLEAK